MSQMIESFCAKDSIASTPSRVFLTRNPDRRPYNSSEIAGVARDLGFVEVNLAELSLSDQVKIFQTAEVVADPTGAAWTNLVFAVRGLKGLIWGASQAAESPAFSSLAGMKDARLRYLYANQGSGQVAGLYSLGY